MTSVDNLTDSANQRVGLILSDGSVATADLRFCGATERWVMDVSYGGEVHRGLGVCTHPNLLRQWQDVLPFGISFVTADMTDPFDVNDFATGRVKVYLLDAADVRAVEVSVFGAPA